MKKLNVTLILLLAVQFIIAQNPMDHIEKGQKLVLNERPNEALVEFKSALKFDSCNQSALQEIWMTFLNLEEYDSAINYCSRAIVCDSNTTKAYIDRGLALLISRMNSSCLSDFKTALSISTDSILSSRAHEGFGYYYEVYEEYSKAYKAFSNGISFNPNNAFLLYKRGNILNKQKKYKDAIRDFNKAIELEADMDGAYTGIGYSLIKLRNHTEAIDYLNKAIQMNPNNALAYYYRGNAWFYLQKKERAEEDLKKANSLGLNRKLWLKPD